MKQLSVTSKAQKNHLRLLDSALPLLNAQPNSNFLHIADECEKTAPHRAGDSLIIIGQNDQPSICRIKQGKTALSYSAPPTKNTVSALIAAATPQGMPIAADTETLALLTLAQRIASSNIPVLIEGPTGTGKEVLARFLHQSSPRHKAPFVAVNCAAMPETMLEALLFGHKKGAFTGASESQQGFFKAADGGTLLLDEIGEMPIALQSKLLRALQEGEIVPLGATAPVKIDVRIIACTNRDLPSEVQAGRFREDLYYRLNVFPLRILPLRKRADDIAPLAFGLLLKHTENHDRPCWISDEAIDLLRSHPWPGNVRELENVIRRAILLADNSRCIEACHISFDRPVRIVSPAPALAPTQAPAQASAIPPASAQAANTPTENADLSEIAFRSEADAIIQVLNDCNGKRAETAKRLGISERTLRYRLADMREAGLAIAGART